MRLTIWAAALDGKIKGSDVILAKDYLKIKEMAQLNHMVSAYLDFADSMTLRHIHLYHAGLETRLNSFIEMREYGLLKDSGKVSAEIIQLRTETEFEKYRIIQDRLFMSDFDKDRHDLSAKIKLCSLGICFTASTYDKDVEPNILFKNNIIIPAFQQLSKSIGKEKAIWRYAPIYSMADILWNTITNISRF